MTRSKLLLPAVPQPHPCKVGVTVSLCQHPYRTGLAPSLRLWSHSRQSCNRPLFALIAMKTPGAGGEGRSQALLAPQGLALGLCWASQHVCPCTAGHTGPHCLPVCASARGTNSPVSHPSPVSYARGGPGLLLAVVP